MGERLLIALVIALTSACEAADVILKALHDKFSLK